MDLLTDWSGESNEMNKLISFLAGALCGALVGSVLVLLITPASGEEMVSEARKRWEDAIREARTAMEETEKELQAQFEQLKRTTG